MRAIVELFSSEESGRTSAISKGFRCISVTNRTPEVPITGYDVMPLLESPMRPGETRELVLLFLTDEGEHVMAEAGTFHLWDGRVFATATILHEPID